MTAVNLLKLPHISNMSIKKKPVLKYVVTNILPLFLCFQTREFWASLPLKQNMMLYPEKVTNLHYITDEEAETTATDQNEKSEEEVLAEVKSSESKSSEAVPEPSQQDETPEKERLSESESSERKKDEL